MATFKTSIRSMAIGLCALSFIPCIASADTATYQNIPSARTGFYLGGFGGWGASNDFNITQNGLAIYHTDTSLLYPLPVVAEGSSENNSVGFGGMHLGYEWLRPHYKGDAPTWSWIPAIELEGIYFSTTAEPELFNTATTRVYEHTFDDSFPMDTGVILVNGILALDNASSWFHPYVGVGLGAAVVSISGADSSQLSPAEAGVNHFNSNTDDLDWTFAAQAKAGLRFVINENLRLFAEYRFLYLGNTNYSFGATVAPGHVDTMNWTLNMDGMYYNSGALGLEITL